MTVMPHDMRHRLKRAAYRNAYTLFLMSGLALFLYGWLAWELVK